jgi:murein L,D-transpeptidase YcbB/YkuD
LHNKVCGAVVAALILGALPAAALAQATPDSVALAIRAEAGGKLKSVYAARGYWPLWVKSGAVSPAADRLIAYLETADVDGLESRDYDVRDVRAAVYRAQGGAP